MRKSGTASVDGYLAALPDPARRVMTRVRNIIRKALPGSEEVISYQMPAFKLDGRIVVYAAAWRDHYSIYPASKRLEAALRDELAPYEMSGRGTIRFPLSAPVPTHLIAAIAKFRAMEVAEANLARKMKRGRGSTTKVVAPGTRAAGGRKTKPEATGPATAARAGATSRAAGAKTSGRGVETATRTVRTGRAARGRTR
jgi:uncharacterized protein YdhG (YjbR/CyaY superfamily)